MVASWHERFLSGQVHNYSIGEETATILPKIWEDAFTEPRELQGFRKWNVAGMDERVLSLVDAAQLCAVQKLPGGNGGGDPTAASAASPRW